VKRAKVLLLTNMISPYRIELFNYLHNHGNFAFRVIALVEKEENREWQVAKRLIEFEYQTLPGLHKFLRKKEISLHLNRGLWRILLGYRPDVVIASGYDALAYWEAFLYCRMHAKNFVLWSGTTLLSTERTHGLVGLMKKMIIGKTNRYISYGTKAAEYLLHMGASNTRIHIGINTVDMDWYRREYSIIRSDNSFKAERSKYPPVMLLYVGQLIERKNVRRLLEAMEKLQDQDVGILIVGSGPQEPELRDFCRHYGLQNVYFEGFKQQPDLPWYYAMADVLVLPSVKEVWGLVVNEALATGLYVLCSDRAGAAYDLIREGWNGRTFDPFSIDQLIELIHVTKGQIEEIRARREAISDHACREFSIERSAKAFLDAIQAITVGCV